MLVDPHKQHRRTDQRLFVTGRREVRTTSSTLRSMWWSRERVKNITRHVRQDSQTWMGLKDDVVGKASEKARVQDHRAPCLKQHARMMFGWRRASHFVMVFVMDVLASHKEGRPEVKEQQLGWKNGQQEEL